MARTTPRVWEGKFVMSDALVKRIYDQYCVALGDEDKAGDMESMSYYEGWRESLEWVLDILYGIDNKVLPEVLREMVGNQPMGTKEISQGQHKTQSENSYPTHGFEKPKE